MSKCICIIGFDDVPKDSPILYYHTPNCPLYKKIDKVTERVCQDLLSRSEIGIKKYGTTLNENKGNERYWLNHAYEEALDLAQYLKRRIMEIDGKL